MTDLIYIGIVAAFFAVSGFYARFCGKLWLWKITSWAAFRCCCSSTSSWRCFTRRNF